MHGLPFLCEKVNRKRKRRIPDFSGMRRFRIFPRFVFLFYMDNLSEMCYNYIKCAEYRQKKVLALNRKEKESTIDLIEVWRLLWRKRLWLLLAAIVCALLVFLYCTFLVTPRYTAATKLYIYSDATNNRSDSMYVTYSELYAAQYLAEPYVAVLKSDSMMQSVIDTLGLNVSTKTLQRWIRISSEENSLVISVFATHEDPQTAQAILLALIDLAPEAIERVVHAGGVSVIDPAKLPTAPSAPRTVRNTVIAALFGAMVMAAVFFATDVMSTTIRKEEDVRRAVSVPVLGTISQIQDNGRDE